MVGHHVVDVGRHRREQPVERLAPRGRRGLLDEVVDRAAYDGLVEGVLVAEVVVEQPARDAGLLGEQVDRELVQRAGRQQPDAEVEQLDAALGGPQPGPGGPRRGLAHDPTLLTLVQ